MIAEARANNDVRNYGKQRKQQRQDDRRRCSNGPADHAGMICVVLVIDRSAIMRVALSAVCVLAAATDGQLMAMIVMGDAEQNLQDQRHKR